MEIVITLLVVGAVAYGVYHIVTRKRKTKGGVGGRRGGIPRDPTDPPTNEV